METDPNSHGYGYEIEISQVLEHQLNYNGDMPSRNARAPHRDIGIKLW